MVKEQEAVRAGSLIRCPLCGHVLAIRFPKLLKPLGRCKIRIDTLVMVIPCPQRGCKHVELVSLDNLPQEQ